MSTSDTIAANPALVVLSAHSGSNRIDRPHWTSPSKDASECEGSVPLPPVLEAPALKEHELEGHENKANDMETRGEELLRLHAESLIRELREWADALETQSAALNVRSAMQDQRETQFRLWESSQRQQLNELSSAAEMRYAAAKEVFVRAAISEFGNRSR